VVPSKFSAVVETGGHDDNGNVQSTVQMGSRMMNVQNNVYTMNAVIDAWEMMRLSRLWSGHQNHGDATAKITKM